MIIYNNFILSVLYARTGLFLLLFCVTMFCMMMADLDSRKV